ncbi:MAG: hypothetical protein OMM_14652, partial [Candidatus Magnetoglobus multicellularis str. Araruama]
HEVEKLDRSIEVPDYKVDEIKELLTDDINFRNEGAIRHQIITPILNVVVRHFKPLKLWIEEPFNVDENKGLTGNPDYLIASRTKTGEMSLPPLCVIEAKKADFDEGWTQALAEMVAVAIKGAKVCYGVVTTGKIWEFGKFESNIFERDPNPLSTQDLQKVFDALYWLFELAYAEITS